MPDDELTARLQKLASANIVHGQAFHLKLPDGWLGRPFDNLYFVKSVEWVRGAMKIETTDDEVLFIADVSEIRGVSDGIAITADGPVSFEWTEYGGKEHPRKLSPSGVVTLAKPVGS
jgi:hypothetical protein